MWWPIARCLCAFSERMRVQRVCLSFRRETVKNNSPRRGDGSWFEAGSACDLLVLSAGYGLRQAQISGRASALDGAGA